MHQHLIDEFPINFCRGQWFNNNTQQINIVQPACAHSWKITLKNSIPGQYGYCYPVPFSWTNFDLPWSNFGNSDVIYLKLQSLEYSQMKLERSLGAKHPCQIGNDFYIYWSGWWMVVTPTPCSRPCWFWSSFGRSKFTIWNCEKIYGALREG